MVRRRITRPYADDWFGSKEQALSRFLLALFDFATHAELPSAHQLRPDQPTLEILQLVAGETAGRTASHQAVSRLHASVDSLNAAFELLPASESEISDWDTTALLEYLAQQWRRRSGVPDDLSPADRHRSILRVEANEQATVSFLARAAEQPRETHGAAAARLQQINTSRLFGDAANALHKSLHALHPELWRRYAEAAWTAFQREPGDVRAAHTQSAIAYASSALLLTGVVHDDLIQALYEPYASAIPLGEIRAS